VKSVVQLRKRTTEGADGTDKAEQPAPGVLFTAPFVPWIHILIIHHGHHITSTRQNRKTYRSVLVRFFCGKAHFAPFFGIPKKSDLQPARHQAFTKGAKTGRLYDTSVFASATAFADFLRNSLKINRMALKSRPTERRQKRVTYNNTPFAKPEK
jgi:hypothetical protein